jgi:predicted deacylase
MTARCRIALSSAVLLLCTAGAGPARAQPPAPFLMGGVTSAPGTTASGSLKVPGGAGDEGTIIPFTVVNGSKPGPVLALIAGTHGVEYPPVLALQRLRTAIDPRTLTGTVVLVHVANMPSFLARTIYYGPKDGQNLNRVFPGKRDGTLSERIAHAITTEVIDRATHVIDIHCGDGNEWLRPYSYWVVTSAPAVVAASKDLALAFGLDHIVIDTERPSDPAASVYLANTAMTRGKPALTAESGGWSRTDEESIARVERGVAGVLKHLGMRADGPPPVAHPVWLGRNEVLRSGFTGLLYPMVEPGETVAQGTIIARVTDFHGTVLEDIRAPFAGEILYVVATPPIAKGEPVGFVAERAAAVPSIGGGTGRTDSLHPGIGR